MVGRVPVGQQSRNFKKVHEMNEPNEINELEVELCVELARLYDTEDLTHPPFRQKEEENEKDD